MDATQHQHVAEQWDVFVSYAHDNADWVRVLAANLHHAGWQVSSTSATSSAGSAV